MNRAEQIKGYLKRLGDGESLENVKKDFVKEFNDVNPIEIMEAEQALIACLLYTSMFLAMAKDIRVIMIKLADRLHNMRTMQYQSPAKQVEKSRETMDIYAPIAHRLGISKIKVELDDLSMKYLMPDTYNDLVKQVDINRPGREAFIKSIIKEVGMHISNAGIEAEIDGRVKHFFSIYRKMVNQNKTLDQIYDIFAVRIKVDTVKDCRCV